MGNEIYRDEVLGDSVKSYSFDKVLRGYDPKQVDEFISSLVSTNKSASEIFDSRYSELKNENTMILYELEQAKEELATVNKLYNACKEERDGLAVKLAKKPAVQTVDNSEQIKELEEKLQKVLTKNRLLQVDNKMLEEKNRDMQRDIAHLTKKVDKNRNKISNLSEQVETGITEEDKNKYYEMVKIYEDAIDKAEDLIFKLQNEFSLAHSKAEDAGADKK